MKFLKEKNKKKVSKRKKKYIVCQKGQVRLTLSEKNDFEENSKGSKLSESFIKK